VSCLPDSLRTSVVGKLEPPQVPERRNICPGALLQTTCLGGPLFPHHTAIIEEDASILSSPVGRAYAQPEPDPEVAFTLQIERDFEKYIKESKGTGIFTVLKDIVTKQRLGLCCLPPFATCAKRLQCSECSEHA
jgi:hypothetical protein